MCHSASKTFWSRLKLQNISVSDWSTDWTTWFDYRRGLGIFLFATASRPGLTPTDPLIQWVPGIKRPRREADHSLQSSAEVKNAWIYTSTLPYVFMVWCLVKPRDSFIR